MKLTLNEVDYTNGFKNGNDLFERAKLGLQLQSIIRHSEDESLVLAIDDQWGSGKTTFLKMWESELKLDEALDVIYFDAFKNDYQEDAFLALSSAIYPKIEKQEDKKKYLNAATKAGKFLLKATAKIGLRAATLGVVKDTDFEGLEDVTKEVIEDPIEKLIEEKLKSAENEIQVIQHFKNTITELAKDKKIVFIIDELDRARPDFSLDLLEKMKHVFNTKNLFFVLAVNKDQFLHIIKKRYGDIDSETYLSKFIHFWFALPQLKDFEGNSRIIPTFIDYISRNLKINGDFRKATILLAQLLKASNASLRDCERCYSLLVLTSANEISREDVYQYSIGISVFLKIKRPDIFKGIVTRTATPEEVLKSLNLYQLKGISTEYLKAIVITDLMTDDELLKAEETKERVLRDSYRDPIRALTQVLPFFESVII